MGFLIGGCTCGHCMAVITCRAELQLEENYGARSVSSSKRHREHRRYLSHYLRLTIILVSTDPSHCSSLPPGGGGVTERITVLTN